MPGDELPGGGDQPARARGPRALRHAGMVAGRPGRRPDRGSSSRRRSMAHRPDAAHTCLMHMPATAGCTSKIKGCCQVRPVPGHWPAGKISRTSRAA